MFKRISWYLVTVLLVLGLALAACAPADEEPVEEPGVEEPGVEEPTEEVPGAGGEGLVGCENYMDVDLSGETVSVLAVWGGDEQESFMAMVQPWEEMTGAQVAYEGTRDLNAVLTTRVQGGNPPDIAGLPGPGQLREYAQAGDLVDLSTFIDANQLSEDEGYDQSWIDLASLDDGLYGLFTKVAVKSMVWYSPPDFQEAGYEIPEDWDGMLALSENIAESGTTPWCIGLESGAASGWPGTDWIEDIMLRTAGPEVYDQWWQHEIAWTDPVVRNAWETWGTIVNNEDWVNGGSTAMLATNFGEAPYPMFQDPPGCYMHKQASFITSFIQDQFPDLQPVDDFNYFAFPSIDPSFGTPALVAGDLFGVFNDTPASRSLTCWLSSADAQRIWAERGGFLSPLTTVDPGVYPDPIIGQAAEILSEAEVVRFDASDLMPAAVNDAFWAGILEYVQNPDNLDQILQDIENVAQEAYQETQ